MWICMAKRLFPSMFGKTRKTKMYYTEHGVNNCNPSTREAEVGGSGIQGKSGPHSKTLSQNTKLKQTKLLKKNYCKQQHSLLLCLVTNKHACVHKAKNSNKIKCPGINLIRSLKAPMQRRTSDKYTCILFSCGTQIHNSVNSPKNILKISSLSQPKSHCSYFWTLTV
jgi:hypothetical protein